MRLAPQGATIWGSCAVFAAALTILSAIVQFPLWIAFISWLPFFAAAWFFRDPDREIPTMPGAVIAPADGKVIVIDAPEQKYASFGFQQKISIFMSPLNVHVNRIPSTGTVAELKYNKGRFLTAFHDKASELNEQQFIALRTEHGMVGFVQIAGWLARRIVCQLRVGQQVNAGERFGLIKFGSRLDVYLPPGTEVKVELHQRVRAGKTILGLYNAKD